MIKARFMEAPVSPILRAGISNSKTAAIPLR